MKPELEPLFTPWRIGNVELKNRIVMTSMGGTNLLGWMEPHHFDRAGAEFVLSVASHDAGLVLPGCQPVYNPMLGQWLHQGRRMYRDLARWMPQLHDTGAKLFVQLTAGFGRSFTVSPVMEALWSNPALRRLSKPVMDLDRICAAPSPAPNRWSNRVPSRQMTKEEIAQIVDAFAQSAARLQEAGVDGVEVHAVHEGYLLDQFTLPYLNHRNDEYGGSLENRYRFACEVVQAIHAACGDDYPVSLRYSVTSKTKGLRQGALPGEKHREAGRDLAESEQAVRLLQDAGYAMLNCDNGTYDAWYWAHPPIYMPENCNLADVEHIKRFVDIPVVAAGRTTPEAAAEAIAAGRLDGAGFARQFLADPAWVTKLKEGRPEDIRPCILCHNGCFNMCHYEGVPNDQDLGDSLHLARCAVNAQTMQTRKHRVRPARSPKSVAVVGGGPAGMEAALLLKAQGHRPVIYEAADRLGGTLVPAGAESYKGKVRELLAWYERRIEQEGIPVRLGVRVDDVQGLPEDEVVVATGSSPITLAQVPGHEAMVEACDFLNGAPVGQRVVVVGGGLTGCEIAYELCLRGLEPVIVEMKGDLVAQKGVCLANSSYLREYFALHEVPVHLNATLKEVRPGEVVCEKNGAELRIPCDSVISSVGYRPAPLEAAPDAGGEKDQAGRPVSEGTPDSAGEKDQAKRQWPLGKRGKGQKRVRWVGDCAEVGNLRTAIWGVWDTLG